MSIPLVLAALWAVCANLLAMMPSRDQHWRSAYILIAFGIPVLGWVTWAHGPWIGLLVLAGAMSILRWPLIYLGRWIRRVTLR